MTRPSMPLQIETKLTVTVWAKHQLTHGKRPAITWSQAQVKTGADDSLNIGILLWIAKPLGIRHRSDQADSTMVPAELQ